MFYKPFDLEEAEGYLVAHRFDEARTTARQTVTDARQAGDVAIVARAS